MGGRLDKTAYRYMLTRRRGLLGPKMGQGRVCTSETKAFSFLPHRTKVFARGAVGKKNNAIENIPLQH